MAEAAPEETSEIFPIGKVEGMDVYRPDGERIGSIESIMIDKRNGKIAYAVMSFGGFLGIGEEFFPIPWELFRYMPQEDAFELDITAETLTNAPKFTDESAYDWSRAEGRRIDEHYGTPGRP
jgi:sporulation protein YlmC with PRC-barrel domain